MKPHYFNCRSAKRGECTFYGVPYYFQARDNTCRHQLHDSNIDGLSLRRMRDERTVSIIIGFSLLTTRGRADDKSSCKCLQLLQVESTSKGNQVLSMTIGTIVLFTQACAKINYMTEHIELGDRGTFGMISRVRLHFVLDVLVRKQIRVAECQAAAILNTPILDSEPKDFVGGLGISTGISTGIRVLPPPNDLHTKRLNIPYWKYVSAHR
ncbi:hypothetical protein GGI42DRAFT_23803 [Trichoderma sp. SZMC 28013]